MRNLVDNNRHYQDYDDENNLHILLKFKTNDSIQFTNSNYMARVCAITGVGSIVGGGYSNRTRATQYNPTGKVRKYANLQKKKIYIPELKKTVTLTISTKALKTINKNGAYATLKKAKII